MRIACTRVPDGASRPACRRDPAQASALKRRPVRRACGFRIKATRRPRAACAALYWRIAAEFVALTVCRVMPPPGPRRSLAPCPLLPNGDPPDEAKDWQTIAICPLL